MTYYSTPPRSDEIWHHGIKGMRWGVRRYQHEDGSLTPAGERHYYKKDGSLKRRGKKYFLKQYKKKAYDNVHKQLDAKYGKGKWVNELHGKSYDDQNRLYEKAFDNINAYKKKLKNGWAPKRQSQAIAERRDQLMKQQAEYAINKWGNKFNKEFGRSQYGKDPKWTKINDELSKIEDQHYENTKKKRK